MQFVVRVYGILMDNMNRILVSDEKIKGKFYTKFPGGGLEFGEGTKDCLVREFIEETGLKVIVGEHLYTTDFFQPSAFNSNHQILSIYYFVSCPDLSLLHISEQKNAFSQAQLESKADCEVFRWISQEKISPQDVDLPIDKVVAALLSRKGKT